MTVWSCLFFYMLAGEERSVEILKLPTRQIKWSGLTVALRNLLADKAEQESRTLLAGKQDFACIISSLISTVV